MTDCIANWSMLLEYLKVLLSGPAVTLYLAAAFFLLFRKEIQGFINRIRSGKFGKLAFDASPQPPVEDVHEIEKAVFEAAKQSAQFVYPEGIAPPEIGRPAVKAAEEPTKEQQAAVRLASQWLRYERLLNAIFDSQLQFLQALESRPGGISWAQAFDYWQRGQWSKFSSGQPPPLPGTPGFDGWLSWLETNGFIKPVQPGPTQKWVHYVLSPEGSRFLEYLRENYRNGAPYRDG